MNKYLNLPTFLILSFLIRLLYLGANIGDSIVMIVLGTLYAGHMYLEHIHEPEANKELKEKILQIDERLISVKNKVDSLGLGAHLKR